MYYTHTHTQNLKTLHFWYPYILPTISVCTKTYVFINKENYMNTTSFYPALYHRLVEAFLWYRNDLTEDLQQDWTQSKSLTQIHLQVALNAERGENAVWEAKGSESG